MKTELRPKPHAVVKGVTVIELWHGGQFIGTIAGADGPGVRIITKHPMTAKPSPDDGSGVNVMEVTIQATE
jgi:hypothetical protein